MFFKEEVKGIVLELKATKGRVNLFKNLFDVAFPVKDGSAPQSEVLEKIYVLERFVIYFNGSGCANVQEVRCDVSFADKEHHLALFEIHLKLI